MMLNIIKSTSGRQKLTGDKNLKRFLTAFCLVLALILSACGVEAKIFARFKKHPKEDIFKRPPLEKRQAKYIEIKDELGLTEEELSAFSEIYTMEAWALRPIALELETKYLRMDELNAKKCRWYQRTCKKELKKDKKFLEDDISELKRQIWQKKEYYKVLYLNATTREQDIKLRKLINAKTNAKPQLW